jgi:hypothetical protein
LNRRHPSRNNANRRRLIINSGVIAILFSVREQA